MTPVTCSVCKAPFAVYGVEPPLEYVCAGCTDPLGGPPVLSPLEERVAALERRLEALEPRPFACPYYGSARIANVPKGAKCPMCGR